MVTLNAMLTREGAPGTSWIRGWVGLFISVGLVETTMSS
jgi:hypothetical protein